VTTNSGSLNVATSLTNAYQDFPDTGISSIDISLRYPDGRLVDLRNREWQFVMDTIGENDGEVIKRR
jgi:hypothetical protein